MALLLFRVFDILKPPPVRQLERLPGGTGIMLDDVAAGLMALAVGHLILRFFSGL
jgi:phosphatidylglycerophosphatase A